jgi:hypothetical protein
MTRLIRQALFAAGLATTGMGAASAGMAEGLYECWFFNEARGGLNFQVDSATSYTSVAQGTTGEYALSGRDLTWVSGFMKGAMPDGFTTIYEVRNGNPTVAFISGRGSEAAFCEMAK